VGQFSRAPKAEDLDKDGQKEIIFASSFFGTGGGSESLNLYVPTPKKLYTLTMQYQWTAPGEPSAKVVLEPEPKDETDQKWLLALEQKSRALRFPAPLPTIDLDDPRNAVVRWHKENGSLEFGPVRLHYYEGEPVCGASGTASIIDGDVLWSAYFKGPVYGYLRSENKHFVVYSPIWSRLWPTCLAADDRFLWIGTSGNGIMRYDKGAKRLRKIVLKFGGKEILEIGSMQIAGDCFEIVVGDILSAVLQIERKARFDLRVLRS